MSRKMQMTTETRMVSGRLAVAALVAVLSGSAVATASTEAVGGLANPAGEARGTARVMGMEATFVGVAEGADTLQWNPAGLGNLTAAEGGVHHLSGLSGAIGESFIAGAPVGTLGGLAVSVDVLDNGRFESRDSSGNLTGSYEARTYGGSLGWGYALTQDLAIGATARGAQQSFGSMKYDSYVGDLGVLWKALPALRVGVAVANVGSSGSASALATDIRAGASWTAKLGERNGLLLAAATAIQPSGLSRLDVGAEGTLASVLALRAGYRLAFTNQQLTGMTGITAGLGLMFTHFALDYAYVPFGELGNLHRVSLTYRMAPSSAGEAATGGAS